METIRGLFNAILRWIIENNLMTIWIQDRKDQHETVRQQNIGNRESTEYTNSYINAVKLHKVERLVD